MKGNKRLFFALLWLALGVVLNVFAAAGVLDGYWGGMGGGLLGIGIVRLVQEFRIRRDAAYRERMEVAQQDERNKYLANRAISWAAYLYLITAGVASVVLQALNRRELSQMAGMSVMLIMLFYWGSYLYLRKKY